MTTTDINELLYSYVKSCVALLSIESFRMSNSNEKLSFEDVELPKINTINMHKYVHLPQKNVLSLQLKHCQKSWAKKQICLIYENLTQII